ncbi:13994_t:CDS:1, partial [Acaulospora morrowiae]
STSNNLTKLGTGNEVVGVQHLNEKVKRLYELINIVKSYKDPEIGSESRFTQMK